MVEERGRIGRAPLVLTALLATQLVLAAVGVGLWARQTFAGDDQPAVRPTLPAEVPRPVTLESGYPLALARAQQWADDARLIMVSAQVDWPLDVPPGPPREVPGGGWLTYVFVRERDGEAESLGVLIERYSGAIVQDEEAEWGGPAPTGALDLLGYPVDSLAALVAAEGAGGTDFRRECPTARHQTRLSLGLAPVDLAGATLVPPGTPVPEASPIATPPPADPAAGPTWLVGYRDVRDEGVAPLTVAVGAGTGAVAVERRDVPKAVGCPA